MTLITLFSILAWTGTAAAQTWVNQDTVTKGTFSLGPEGFTELDIYGVVDGEPVYAGTLSQVADPNSKTPALVFSEAKQLAGLFAFNFELGTTDDGDVLHFEMGPTGELAPKIDGLYFEMDGDGEYLDTTHIGFDLPTASQGLIVDDIQFLPIALDAGLFSRPDAEGTTTRPDAEGTTTRPDAEGTTTRPDAEGIGTYEGPLFFVPENPELLAQAIEEGIALDASLTFKPVKEELFKSGESHWLEVYVEGADLTIYASWLDEKVAIPGVVGVGVN